MKNLNKISTKIKELQEAIHEVTGQDADITIDFHFIDFHFNDDVYNMETKKEKFSRAKRIANNITLDSPEFNQHKVWSGRSDSAGGIRVRKDGDHKRYICVFL